MSNTHDAIPMMDLGAAHREIADEITAGFAEVIDATAFAGGRWVTEFERDFAELSGVRHCIGCANGTDALEIALRAAGVGVDDEVIVPANTFVATAEAVVRMGARVRFVDVDDQHLLMDPALVDAAITPRTRAIIPVHLYGQLAPMPELLEVAARHDLVVIEDAAQSQGATRDGRPSGSWGTVAATSFYPGKNLGAYGDAGAVMTDSDTLARTARLLGAHGAAARYQHEVIGFNSRLDSLQAVVLSAKLRRLREWNATRRIVADRYDAMLAEVQGVRRPVVLPGNEHVWHLYVVRVRDRDRVLEHLRAGGVEAAIHYPVPVHLQAGFRAMGHAPGEFPVTEAAADQILSLPMHPHLTREQQERVVDLLDEALRATGAFAATA